MYQGAIAQGLHDAAHLQYLGIVVMQVDDNLGTPEEHAERWTPSRIASDVHIQSFRFQVLQDYLQAHNHHIKICGPLLQYLLAFVTSRLQTQKGSCSAACSWHLLWITGTILQLGPSCCVHTSTTAHWTPEAAMLLQVIACTQLDHAGAICKQPSACRSCIRSAAPLCPCSPVPLGGSAPQLEGLIHGTSELIGSMQLQ